MPIFVSLRGFQASGLNSRLDGIPTPENAAIPLEIMDRVDVLRGPSGFLYGATAPSGAGVAERAENYRPGNDPHRYVGSIALDWSLVEALHLQAGAVLGRDAPRDGGGFQVFIGSRALSARRPPEHAYSTARSART